jgi:hypothetical protein
MKTVYLLYISAGIALATIFYLYKSHKETMKKIETVQNLVSAIQQVPVMKYNDSEIQATINARCDNIEELIHFVNDDINTKLETTLNSMNNPNRTQLLKKNVNKNNIPKEFFSDFIESNEDINNNLNFRNVNNSSNNSQTSENMENNRHLENLFNLEDREFIQTEFKKYHNDPIDIENYKDDDLSGLSLSPLDKAALDIDSVHNSSIRIEKTTLGELNNENNNEDLIETFDLNNKLSNDIDLNNKISNDIDLNNKISNDIDLNLNLDLDNKSVKSTSNNVNQDSFNNQTNISCNHSVSDNSKIPKLHELKQIAKSRDLSTNGNKKEIIQRLLDNGYNF